MELLIIISVGFAIFAYITIDSFFYYKMLKKLKEERIKNGITSKMFFHYFLEKGVDEKFCQVVYEDFQKWVESIGNFPIMPLDNIFKIYRIADETLDDAILEILARYQNIPVKNVDVTNIPEATIQTIDDLVMALWKQANSQPGKAKPAK